MFKKLLSMLVGRSKDTPVFRLGDPGMATHSIIKVDEHGNSHEHLLGRSGYGKGHEPVGGHKPDTVILTEAHAYKLAGRIYPVADISQLVAQENDSDAILANTQGKIQFGTKGPNE